MVKILCLHFFQWPEPFFHALVGTKNYHMTNIAPTVLNSTLIYGLLVWSWGTFCAYIFLPFTCVLFWSNARHKIIFCCNHCAYNNWSLILVQLLPAKNVGAKKYHFTNNVPTMTFFRLYICSASPLVQLKNHCSHFNAPSPDKVSTNCGRGLVIPLLLYSSTVTIM